MELNATTGWCNKKKKYLFKSEAQRTFRRHNLPRMINIKNTQGYFNTICHTYFFDCFECKAYLESFERIFVRDWTEFILPYSGVLVNKNGTKDVLL